MSSVRPANASIDSKSSLGRFLCAFGPKVSEKGCASTAIFAWCSFRPFTFFFSEIKDMGSLFCLSRYEVGSDACAWTAERKLSSASCEMTRVLLNHFLLGSTRATGASRLWYEAAFVMSPLALRWALPSVRRLRTFTFLALR